jgi:hypothetical protein
MTIYTVLAPPAAGPAGPDPDRFVFIKEGFCWPAFFFGAIWLLFRRLWLVFLLYLLAAAVLSLLAAKMPDVAWLVALLFAFLVGLEANNLRRWTLERRGYRFVGAAAGHRLAEAEFRFFSAWRGEAAKEETPRQRPEPPKPAALPPIATGEIVGLFPQPGGAS